MPVSNKSKSHDPVLLTVIIFLFGFSRIGYYLAGFRFDAFVGEHLLHFISVDLLKNNLLQSIYYLHTQPPLFNVFIGVIYKLFPLAYITAFHAVYLGLGLMLTVSLFLIMRKLGVSGTFSTTLTVLFIISPSCLLFENLLLYTYPVVTLLVLSALFLYRFLKESRSLDGHLFFILLAIIVLTRSIFHIVWFMLWVVLLIILKQKTWKHILLASCVPFLIIMGLYVKNLYLFGNFSSSSWFGMSFSKMTTFKLPEEERTTLMRKGKLSELSLLPPFKSLWFYNQYINIPHFTKTGIPVLDMEFFPEEGNNWNNMAFISISKQYLRDAVFVLKNYPYVYVKSVVHSFVIFFFPSSDWFHFYPSIDNISKMKHIESLYNSLIYGQFSHLSRSEMEKGDYEAYINDSAHLGFFLAAGFLIAVLYGVYLIVRSFRIKSIDIPFAVTVVFITINILYVTVVANCLETGENQRFRFNIDPFIVILCGLFINNGLILVKEWIGKHHTIKKQYKNTGNNVIQTRSNRCYM